VLKRANPLDVPTVAFRSLNSRAKLSGHRQIHPFAGLSELTIRSIDDRPLPIQVDGDYIGAATEARFDVVPGGLTVIA
jgi:diacylglycerol kinase family enzyme